MQNKTVSIMIDSSADTKLVFDDTIISVVGRMPETSMPFIAGGYWEEMSIDDLDLLIDAATEQKEKLRASKESGPIHVTYNGRTYPVSKELMPSQILRTFADLFPELESPDGRIESTEDGYHLFGPE